MTTDGLGFWNRTAARYDASMWLLGGPVPRMTAQVADVVRGSERVLELAAGTGLVTAAIAPVVGQVVATDYAPAMVERLARRVAAMPNVTTRVLDVYAMNEPPGSFDAVVAANVLHLLPDLDGALDAMLRVLRPGGRLVVPTYLHDATVGSRATSHLLGWAGFPGQRRFTLDSLRTSVGGHGVRILRSEQLGGLLPIGFVAAEVK
ncbi:MAG: class I SAM-dependent methyltransferase [Myxococcota bacterium]|jgi:phosphatidylethanolamine/phosphatidyl-N-methylethanolamine N-methyltransferase